MGWNWQNANDKSTGAILIGTSKGELNWVKQPIACPQGQQTWVPQCKSSSVHAPCSWWHLQDGQLQQTILKLRISEVIYLSRNDTTCGVECNYSVAVMAFSLCARILRECSTIYFPPVLFSFLFKVEIRLHTLMPLFRLGLVHSGSASWDDWGQAFPVELHVSSFPDRFPHCACTAA